MTAFKSENHLFTAVEYCDKAFHFIVYKLHFNNAFYHLNSILTVSLICNPINAAAEPLFRDIVNKPVEIKSAIASPAATSLYFLLMLFIE